MTLLLKGAGGESPADEASGGGDGGGGGGDPTVTLSINGSSEIGSGFAGQVVATLSATRLVDTELAISNGGQSEAELVTPQTIPAGELSVAFFVGNTGGYDGAVTISATTDVEVLNTVEFQFSSM